MRIAFKEWAVVVDSLARGEQIIVLRRGGISEEPGGFTLEHDRFLLFPTLFHQQRDLVIRSAQDRYDQLAATLSPSQVSINAFAEVIDWRRIASPAEVEALRGQHIWRDSVVQERLERPGEGSLYAVAVRVFRLPAAVTLPMLPQYGGCRSWIEVDADISVDGAEPALLPGEFQMKLEDFEKALSPARGAVAQPGRS